MSRYTGPAYRRSRRFGFSTLESGKDLARRPYPPGQHGRARRRKPSEYGLQLQEKQKVRCMYGLTEKQFCRTFNRASKSGGIVGEEFLKTLESRLDNIVFRMGLSNTRRGARQLVNHGHVIVDGVPVDIPSFNVKPGSVITLKERSLNHPAVKQALENTLARPAYVEFDPKKMTGTYVRHPERSELHADINEALIVEFYNR